MRTARLVGQADDGASVLLVTEDGEEIRVAVDPDDPALRPLLGPGPDRSRPTPADAPAPAAPVRPPRRRETPMDTQLSPRDIQTRIRSGESLEDVVAGSGLDAERVERFAAPVLAEREHLALTALGSSVRRRGEASGHRPLRAVVAERLLGQGVDEDEVSWDAWKRDDSSWQLSADYELSGEARHAEFRFDAQGRFSVAEDDEARWLAGEAPSPVAASLDRDDELALVRATREPSHDDAHDAAGAQEEPDGLDAAETQDQIRAIAAELGAVLQVVPPVGSGEDEPAEADEPVTGDEPTLVALRDEAAEPTVAVVRHLTRLTVEVDTVDALDTAGGAAAGAQDGADEAGATPTDEARSALDTLYDMLGGYAEESPRVYAGLSDATAVPVVDEREFEPPADVLVPAEPEPAQVEEDADDALVPRVRTNTDTDTEGDVDRGRPESTQPAHEPAPEAEPEPATDDVPEPLVPSPGATRKPGRRKRAAVPSWDEIMFGGPKPG